MKLELKSILLIGLGLFLFSRVLAGNLFFYINERFFALTIFAIVSLFLLGLSYYFKSDLNDDPHAHEGHSHSQPLTWAGLLLITAPITFGLLVPPQPLGAAAMTNRDTSIESLTSASAPKNDTVLTKPQAERNILDWVLEFRATADPSRLAGEEVKVVGFVYRDDRFGDSQFMVSRFVLSCCAADAAPLGMIVSWPESSRLPADQWVEVTGYLEPGEFDGEQSPLIIADSVTEAEIPSQPYLYPF